MGAFHGIRIVYRMRITGGALRHEVDESTDMAAWFSLDQVRELPTVELVPSSPPSPGSRHSCARGLNSTWTHLRRVYSSWRAMFAGGPSCCRTIDT